MSNESSENVVTTTEAIEVLKRLVMHFPTDGDLLAAGWELEAVDDACGAYEAALALIARAPTA